MDGKFVSYLRVSTNEQGKSGLGLEAQRAAVAAHLNGGNWTLLAEHVEVESGKSVKNRPHLAAALKLCKLTGATLLISRLDRLARNVRFIAGLMEEGVPFVACDMPNATPFMLHIYASVAEEEAKAISRRTKVALAAAKARGKVLGGYRGAPAPDAAAGGAARRTKALAFAADVAPIAAELRESGLSLRGIADALTEKGVRTPLNRAWTAQGVKNLLSHVQS